MGVGGKKQVGSLQAWYLPPTGSDLCHLPSPCLIGLLITLYSHLFPLIILTAPAYLLPPISPPLLLGVWLPTSLPRPLSKPSYSAQGPFSLLWPKPLLHLSLPRSGFTMKCHNPTTGTSPVGQNKPGRDGLL